MKVSHRSAARPYLEKLKSLAALESSAWQVFMLALSGEERYISEASVGKYINGFLIIRGRCQKLFDLPLSLLQAPNASLSMFSKVNSNFLHLKDRINSSSKPELQINIRVLLLSPLPYQKYCKPVQMLVPLHIFMAFFSS